ncbi:TlpA family protein disulfide reductase [Hydrogenimonas sp.]
MRAIRLTGLLSLALLALLAAGCGDKKESATRPVAKNPTTAEKPAPTRFTLKEGSQTIEAKLTDKGVDFNVSEPIVMIDFFATWCPPCRAEIPHLANLQKRYEGKLKIIGILVENKHPAELKRFINGHGINYFVSNAPDNMPFADGVMEMLHQPRNFSIPFMVIFVKGKYYRHYMGLVPEEMLESDIKEALKEVK